MRLALPLWSPPHSDTSHHPLGIASRLCYTDLDTYNTRTIHEQIIISTSVKSCEVIIVSLAGSHADRRGYITTTHATRSAYLSPYPARSHVGYCATHLSPRWLLSLASPKPHGLLRSTRCSGLCLPPPRVWSCTSGASRLYARCTARCNGARCMECWLPCRSWLAADGRR